MKKKIKTAAGFLTVIFCILAGCERKDEEARELLFLTEEEGSQETVFRQEERSFSDPGGMKDGQEDMEGSASLKESGSTPFQDTQPQEGGGIREETKVCVVHICGAVNEPGVYTMENGSRVYQVIEQAGGFREDAQEDYLNQADLLADGMKIYVPSREETEQGEGDFSWKSFGVVESGGGEAAEEESSPLININTAGEEQLCTLPGVGSSKARSIISWREQNGAYRTIEDIMNVEGIKDGVFQKIKDSITV